MDTILTKLCNGEIYANSTHFITPRYEELADEIEKKQEELANALTAADYRRLENLIDLHIEQLTIETEDAFVHGIKTGSLLILELLSDEKGLNRLFASTENESV